MSAPLARAASVLSGLALAGLMAGCGLTGPARPAATTSTTSTTGVPSAAAIARARTTHELPTPVGSRHVSGGWSDPEQAVRVFAATYINWSAATIASRLRGLEGVSVGQARSLLAQTAGEVARDSELHAGGVANSGTVEAVSPLRGQRFVYAVVTRERTSAARDAAYAGLRPAWHVALASVTQVDGLWVLSRWVPES